MQAGKKKYARAFQDSRNWILEMLIFEKRGEVEYTEKNL